jgi:hypothetical protein
VRISFLFFISLSSYRVKETHGRNRHKPQTICQL